MMRFSALTIFPQPALHLWKEGTEFVTDLRAVSVADTGWAEFEYTGAEPLDERTRFMLLNRRTEGGRDLQDRYENEAHIRRLTPVTDGTLPSHVWFVQGSARVTDSDPEATSERDSVRISLLTASRYLESDLYILGGGADERLPPSGTDTTGPYWDLQGLQGRRRRFFMFKFVRRNPPPDHFEPDYANRLWIAADGGTVWTHSESLRLLPAAPVREQLAVHFRQELPAANAPRLQVSEPHSGFYEPVVGEDDAAEGWTVHKVLLFTGFDYELRFRNMGLPEELQWERAEVGRRLSFTGAADVWTLEGDPAVFNAPPARDRTVTLQIVERPPYSLLGAAPLFAHVWINLARAPLQTGLPVAGDGTMTLTTYPGVLTSVKLFDENGRWEGIDRHPLLAGPAAGQEIKYIVLERPPQLDVAPPPDRFRDPPFVIRRPGAYAEDNQMRFVFHAPLTARVQLVAEWTGWLANPVEMNSTEDGSYWWASEPVADILANLPGNDYHGVRYRFLVDGRHQQRDPAAGWTDNSAAAREQWSTRLIRSDRFVWSDAGWQRPGWEYLIIYQLHAARFSNRNLGEAPLYRVAREIEDQAGYLRGLGVTAIQLLPVNDVGSRNSWGYDPAFFYAVEEDYGGPDALKYLVDVCHRHGLAVLLDVVFNHAGHQDNILWMTARETYFDGDTNWGAMINFDHPQCIHFFAQNLVYLAQEFRIDGFRFDFTQVIISGHQWVSHVRQPGSGGGWEFLHAVRSAVRTQVGERCVLIAEHLPNDWAVTNYGGPMDSQWGDDFHDRLVDACRGWQVMSPLADALKISQERCQQWYNVTNYPESHDEVGNVNDRIANVAGFGRGLRMSKVAAAATLLSRGIPMYFMGAESAEYRQFEFGSSTNLNLDEYLADADRGRVRAWWAELARLRRNPAMQGPAPLSVRFAEGQTLAFSRGEGDDFYVLLNFGGWSGIQNLGYLNLPNGLYRELWNSTWPAFVVMSEGENEHTNGGREARLHRGNALSIPDYGAVVLERAG